MPPRKSEEIPVAERKEVIYAYQREKNKAELGRMLGIPRTTIKFFQIGYNRWIQKRRWSSENVIEKKNEFNFMV